MASKERLFEGHPLLSIVINNTFSSFQSLSNCIIYLFRFIILLFFVTLLCFVYIVILEILKINIDSFQPIWTNYLYIFIILNSFITIIYISLYLKLDREILFILISSSNYIQYQHLYQVYNQTNLNDSYSKQCCVVCNKSLHTDIILKCGHIYHKSCLYKLEINHCRQYLNKPFKCHSCNKEYKWTDKYSIIDTQ